MDTLERLHSFQSAVNSVSDLAIFLLSREGVILTWSSGAEKIKGFAPEEVIGKCYSVLFSSQARDQGVPASQLYLARCLGNFTDQGLRFRKNGEGFMAKINLTALRDETGDNVGFIKVTREIYVPPVASIPIDSCSLKMILRDAVSRISGAMERNLSVTIGHGDYTGSFDVFRLTKVLENFFMICIQECVGNPIQIKLASGMSTAKLTVSGPRSDARGKPAMKLSLETLREIVEAHTGSLQEVIGESGSHYEIDLPLHS